MDDTPKYVTRSHDFHPDEFVWPESRFPVYDVRPWDKMVRVADYAVHLPESHDPEAAYPWDDSQWNGEWLWGDGGITAREAHFWFVALTTPERHTDTRHEHTSIKELRRRRYGPSIEYDEARDRMVAWFAACDAMPARARRFPYAYLARLLRPLLHAHELIDLIFEVLPAQEVRPYLEHVRAPEDPELRALASDAARRHLSTLDYAESWAQYTALKMLLGLDVPSELSRLVDALSARKDPADADAALATIALIEDRDAFLAALASMPVPVRPSDIARLFGRGGHGACRVLFERARQSSSGYLHASFERLMHIHSPEASLGMLELATGTPVARAARAWLMDEGHNAVVGLSGPAASPTHPRGALALDILREMRARGREVIIEQAAEDMDPAVWATLEPMIFERGARPSTDLPEDQWPEWLAALATDHLPGAFPDYIAPQTLPRLVTKDGYVLPEPLVLGVLARLRSAEFDAFDDALPQVRRLLEPESAASFAWAIFELWIDAGGPPKHKFCLAAVGWLGDREASQRLLALAERWPRENHIARARWAVDAMRLIEDTESLLDISHVARRARSRGLRSHAAQALDDVAQRMGLSRDELEDRLVPDCGLGADGVLHVNLGEREYDIVLLPGMTLAVRGEDGKTSTRFPRARKSDAPELYRVAKKRWSAVRDQLSRFTDGQIRRFEAALATQRSWRGQDLLDFVVNHPILTSLAQQLVWRVEPDAPGDDPVTFTVTDDRALVGPDDEEVTLEPDHRVTLLHPAGAPAELVSRWSAILADDERVPPFPQLDRRVSTLDEGALAGDALDLTGTPLVNTGELYAWAERHGWERGEPQDAGSVTWFLKPMPARALTAFVRFDPGFFISDRDYGEDQSLETFSVCRRADTRYPAPYYKADRGRGAVPLSSLDPVSLSELLLELSDLVGQPVGVASSNT